jgi:hypothetical protein
MEEKTATAASDLFAVLVLQYQMTAMIALGKLVNPVTKKVERRLDEARHFIDMLGMLEEKTRGNLTREEADLLRKILTELRLNYVDEARKPEPKPEEPKPAKPDPKAEEKEALDTWVSEGGATAPEKPGGGAAREKPAGGTGAKPPSGKPGAPPRPPIEEDPTVDIGGEGSA